MEKDTQTYWLPEHDDSEDTETEIIDDEDLDKAMRRHPTRYDTRVADAEEQTICCTSYAQANTSPIRRLSS